MRLVVVLCGPAGCGKTTAALDSGLEVYDRDDPEWSSEKQFAAALAGLARVPDARAVVIRSGATSSARAKSARLVAASHVFVMPLPSLQELGHRIARRDRADKIRGLASVRAWFRSFDQADGVATFPGWDAIGESGLSIGMTSREW